MKLPRPSRHSDAEKSDGGRRQERAAFEHPKLTIWPSAADRPGMLAMLAMLLYTHLRCYNASSPVAGDTQSLPTASAPSLAIRSTVGKTAFQISCSTSSNVPSADTVTHFSFPCSRLTIAATPSSPSPSLSKTFLTAACKSAFSYRSNPNPPLSACFPGVIDRKTTRSGSGRPASGAARMGRGSGGEEEEGRRDLAAVKAMPEKA